MAVNYQQHHLNHMSRTFYSTGRQDLQTLTAQGIAPTAEIVERRPGEGARGFHYRRYAHRSDFNGGSLVGTR